MVNLVGTQSSHDTRVNGAPKESQTDTPLRAWKTHSRYWPTRKSSKRPCWKLFRYIIVVIEVGLLGLTNPKLGLGCWGWDAKFISHLTEAVLGQLCPQDGYGCIQTPMAAIAELNKGGKVVFEPGCHVNTNDTSKFAAVGFLCHSFSPTDRP